MKIAIFAMLWVSAPLWAHETSPTDALKPLGIYESEGQILLMESGLNQESRKAFSEEGLVWMGPQGSAHSYTVYEVQASVPQKKEPRGYVLGLGTGVWVSDQSRAFALGVSADLPVSSEWAFELEAGKGAERVSMGSSLLWLPRGKVQPFMGLGALTWYEQSRAAFYYSGSGWNVGGQALAGLRFWLSPLFSLGTRAAFIVPLASRGSGTDMQFFGTLGLAL